MSSVPPDCDAWVNLFFTMTELKEIVERESRKRQLQEKDPRELNPAEE